MADNTNNTPNPSGPDPALGGLDVLVGEWTIDTESGCRLC